MRRSEDRYRSLVQAGAQVVWVTTPTGEIAEDSPEWRWITGQTVEEYLGNGWLDVIHPEDRDRVEQDWRESLRLGQGVRQPVPGADQGAGPTATTTCARCPSSGPGRSSSGWARAPTSPASARPRRCAGRLTEQLSAAALRTARLQQATSMLAEALTVEQVVEVITEVGRSAVGAERSAVAMLDPDGLRLQDGQPGRPARPARSAARSRWTRPA